jgi:hypothetical protein
MAEKKGGPMKRTDKKDVVSEKASTYMPAAGNSMLDRIGSLEERVARIEASLPGEKTIVLSEISKEEAKKEIRRLFSEGKTLYYSDIAERLRLDLRLVVEICDELRKNGEIEVVGDTLRSR